MAGRTNYPVSLAKDFERSGALSTVTSVMTIPILIFVTTFALMFYILGATFMEGFVNYRTWRLIGAAEFPAYHRSVGRKVVPFVALPVIFSLLTNVCLLRYRPGGIPTWCLWCTLILTLFAMGISIAFQIPIQLDLDLQGLSQPRISRLISVEWLRAAAHIANATLFLWMMTIYMKGAR